MSQETTNLSIPCLDAFRAWLTGHDRSNHSVRAYGADVCQFAAWFTGHTGEAFALPAVTEYDVQAWRDALAGNRQPASVNRKLAALGTLFRWAVETGQVAHDPTAHVSGVAQQPLAPKALSEGDLTRILRAAQKHGDPRDCALLELLAATGLRAAEVAGLTLGDLDLGERHGWVTVRGKGRKQRRVPLHTRARRAIAAYLTGRQGEGARGRGGEEERGGLAPESPLFLTQQGTAMTPYTLWYTVKKYAAEAGVADVSPHTFRHTVATRLVRDPEVDLVTAATFLGHSRLDTTARYSQPSAEDLAQAAQRLL